MRPLVTSYRLQGLSDREVVECYEESAMRLSRELSFGGRKLKPGPLLNALVHWFCELDENQQRELAAYALGRLELALAEDDEEKKAAARKLDSLPEPKPRSVAPSWPTTTVAEAKRKKRNGTG